MSDEIEKSYFTIGEVSRILDETPSLLRFWEKEFERFLKPDKTAGGTRKYSKKDIQVLRHIHYLVKEKGYTLKGAKEVLQKEQHPADKAQIIDTLTRLRSFLADLKSKL